MPPASWISSCTRLRSSQPFFTAVGQPSCTHAHVIACSKIASYTPKRSRSAFRTFEFSQEMRALEKGAKRARCNARNTRRARKRDRGKARFHGGVRPSTHNPNFL